jgi:hypothetical protein
VSPRGIIVVVSAPVANTTFRAWKNSPVRLNIQALSISCADAAQEIDKKEIKKSIFFILFYVYDRMISAFKV